MTAPPKRYCSHGTMKASPSGFWMRYGDHEAAIAAALDALRDPSAVHRNMLRGTIAKPSLAQIAHIYGDEWTAAIAAAEARGREHGLRETARLAFDRYLGWNTECGVHCDATACEDIGNAILALIPLSPSPVAASPGGDSDNKGATDADGGEG